MPAPQFDAVKEATDAFTLLFKRRNWLLGAPTVAPVKEKAHTRKTTTVIAAQIH